MCTVVLREKLTKAHVRYVNWLCNHLVNKNNECSYEDTVRNKEIMGQMWSGSFLFVFFIWCFLSQPLYLNFIGVLKIYKKSSGCASWLYEIASLVILASKLVVTLTTFTCWGRKIWLVHLKLTIFTLLFIQYAILESKIIFLM